MTKCRLKKNAFERWILLHEQDDLLAWTGTTWALVKADGMPGWRTQVCNFASPERAGEYAKQYGLSIVSEVR